MIAVRYILSQIAIIGIFAIPLSAAQIGAGFDAPEYTMGGTALAGQPSSSSGPWKSAWIKGSGSANKVVTNTYAAYNDPVSPNYDPNAPTTTPTGGSINSDDGLVQISNSSTLEYRSFVGTNSGTVTASYWFYISSSIVSSKQPVEFALLFSNEGVGNINGQLDIAAGIGVREFTYGKGKNKTKELNYGYWDANLGPKGEWVSLGRTHGIEEGWVQLTLSIDFKDEFGNPVDPTYTASYGSKSNSASQDRIIYGDKTDLTDNIVRSVGFDRVSAGSGKFLYADELLVDGVVPEPSTIAAISLMLLSGIFLVYYKKKLSK